jgi:hypothetical protein
MSLKPYDEMVRLYPGGFNVALEGGETHRWPIDEAKYKQLLGTGKAYLSGYTHGYSRTSSAGLIDGRSKEMDYIWFNVQPHEREIYNPPIG